jgi:NitT/TauT family transport system ATP-binding protein
MAMDHADPPAARGVVAPLIALDGVSKRYRARAGDTVVAVEGATLQVRDGEFVTIVGPSGCGKTTLLKLVGGLLAPSTGRVLFRGRPLDGPSTEVGTVFQAPILLPWRTAINNVLLPIEMLGRSRRAYRSEAERLLATVGLTGFEHRFPRELSGGMQQRVAICRALIHEPHVLLMDEPFGALDAMTREELGLALLGLWSERRKTVLFVTHSISEAILLADRVVVMAPGPGRVVATLAIELPRPRTLEMLYSDAVRGYSGDVRDALARDWASRP